MPCRRVGSGDGARFVPGAQVQILPNVAYRISVETLRGLPHAIRELRPESQGNAAQTINAMPDLTLDLRYLHFANAAAEQGSFRRAAMVLGVPQSSISRRVQALENRLGIAIFERRRAGFELRRPVGGSSKTLASGLSNSTKRSKPLPMSGLLSVGKCMSVFLHPYHRVYCAESSASTFPLTGATMLVALFGERLFRTEKVR